MICPGGASDNSPAIYRWVCGPFYSRPSRRDDRTSTRRYGDDQKKVFAGEFFQPSLRDDKQSGHILFPAMNRWAILNRPYGSKKHAARNKKGTVAPSLFLLLDSLPVELAAAVFFELFAKRVGGERLYQIIRHTGLNRLHDATFFRFGGDHDDRHFGVL